MGEGFAVCAAIAAIIALLGAGVGQWRAAMLRRRVRDDAPPTRSAPLKRVAAALQERAGAPRAAPRVFHHISIDAVVTPDGALLIGRAVERAVTGGRMSVDEAAFLMAHELAHLALRHRAYSVGYGEHLWARGQMSAAAADPALKIAARLVQRVTPGGDALTALWFGLLAPACVGPRSLSAEAEYAADAWAADALAAIGCDPEKGAAIIPRAAAQHRRLRHWTQGHPDPSRRAAALRAGPHAADLARDAAGTRLAAEPASG